MSEQSDRIDRAVAHMLLHHAWWASLLLNLRRRITDAVPTMATDGTHLLINESFVATLSTTELEAVLMHEVGHCALLHPFRRGAREPMRWNIAADAAVNALLEADGISLPPDCVPPADLGVTAEELYDTIKTRKLPMADLADAGDIGAQTEPSGAMTANDWRQAVAASRGIEPKGIRRSIESSGEPKCDWRAELAAWASSTVKSADRSWNLPSRRYAQSPGRKRDPESRIAICVDTSGSVDDALLSMFGAEMKAICGVQGVEVFVIACDAAVHAVYAPGEEWSSLPGGGGTDFRPALHRASELEVDGVVYLTDGSGEYGEDISLPVIWAMSTSTKAPWGTTIQLEAL